MKPKFVSVKKGPAFERPNSQVNNSMNDSGIGCQADFDTDVCEEEFLKT